MKPYPEFQKEIMEGLRSVPKKISSKYFYDDEGDKLFHYIMQQPEYYLTCAEYEILHEYKKEIFDSIDLSKGVHLIEPGAGDGLKTKILIDYLIEHGIHCIYHPIDISSNVLDILCTNLSKLYPQLICNPIVGDYRDVSQQLPQDGLPRVLLYLGSNLGNYSHEPAIVLLKIFAQMLLTGDIMLIGTDIVKDPNTILEAYNDRAGYTRQFNLNLLDRLNKELGTNFKTDQFVHFPVYNPILQQAESYLVSKIDQQINFPNTGDHIELEAWEAIHTEISRKFRLKELVELSTASGFQSINQFFDKDRLFCCNLWKK